MIKSDFIINKLDKLFNEELQDVVIYRTNEGLYELYNHYTITKETNKTYTVKVKNTFTESNFYSLKNAVIWCNHDKRNKILSAKRIFELDKKLQNLDVQINLHRELLQKSKTNESKLIYFSKLSDEKVKKQQIVKELESYINDANNWQQKMFDGYYQ